MNRGEWDVDIKLLPFPVNLGPTRAYDSTVGGNISTGLGSADHHSLRKYRLLLEVLQCTAHKRYYTLLGTVDNHGNKYRECRVFCQNAVVLRFHKNILLLIGKIWSSLCDFAMIFSIFTKVCHVFYHFDSIYEDICYDICFKCAFLLSWCTSLFT